MSAASERAHGADPSAPASVAAAAPRSLIRRIATTPLRDALRGRLSGRLDLDALIAGSALPAPLPDLVRRVARRTRLWRLEKADVARELVAHFKDGLNAGREPAALAADFGDADAAAKLIRRAKRRARPLAWQVWRRALQGALATFALLAVVYFYFAIPFWLKSPNITRNYLQELNAPAAAVPEEDRAWPVYRAALLAVGEWPEGRAAPEGYGQWPGGREWKGMRPGHPGWAEMASFVRERAAALETARRAADMPALGFIMRDGVHAEDRELWPERYADNPARDDLEPGSWLINTSLPYVELRRLAQLLLVDARLALAEGDGARAADNFVATLRMAEHLRTPPLLIGQLVSFAVAASMFETLGEALVAHPAAFADAELVELAHRIGAFAGGGRIGLDLVGERTFIEDFVQRVYSDDGAGGGRLTAEGLRLLNDAAYFSSGDQSMTSALSSGALGPAAAAVFADRRQLKREFDRLVAIQDQEGSEPLWARGPSSIDLELDELNGSPLWSARFLPLALLMPALSTASENAELFTQLRDAALVAITLELHRRAEGAWPRSLEALAPRYLPEVPKDRFDGRPIKYRIGPDGPVLYSVGADRDDDGGVSEGATQNQSARRWRARVVGENTGDWILWPPIIAPPAPPELDDNGAGGRALPAPHAAIRHNGAMRLYIVRHGRAERDSRSGLDEDRRLQPRGERQAAWIGERIAERERARQPGAPVDALILASPYVRARETADHIRPALGCEIRYEAALEVGCHAREALALAVAHAEALGDGESPALLLVGHNPQLEALVWSLHGEAPGGTLPLRTGEVVVFDLAEGAEGFVFVERLRMDDDVE